MKSVSQLLYGVADLPHVEHVETVNCRCWLCGAPTLFGVPWKRWQGANFTDQNKCSAPESGHVCPACVWVCSWVQPPGHTPPAEGKKGLNLRLFTHMFDGRGYLYRNKAAKPDILAWLRGPHDGEWFASIADTGQKHTIPWTPINPSGLVPGKGLVYFEQAQLQLGDWGLVDALRAILTLGVTKKEVGSGDYSARSWGIVAQEIQGFEGSWARFRGSSWFTLALWLSQRDEKRWREIDAERKARSRARKNAGTAGRPASRRKGSSDQSGSKSAQTHRTDSDSHDGGGEDKRQRRGVVHDAGAKASTWSTAQLDLFDAF